MVELEDNFKKNGGKFEKFRLDDLFESSVGDFDIQAKHINDKGDYVVSSGLSNGGVIGKTDISAKIFKENSLTVDMFGNVFFRDFKYKMVTHARVFSLTFKNKNFSPKVGLYFAASLKFLNKVFSYNNMASFNKIKSLNIFLPTFNSKIAFNYMEQYVQELESDRMQELNAYLLASGLNNYELSKDEEELLQGKINLDFQLFRLGDIFEIKKGTRLTKNNMLQGDIKFIGSSSLNNGCTSLIGNKDSLHPANVITVCYNGSVGESFYQDERFWASDDVNILYPNNFSLDSDLALYFVSAIKKLKSKYSYSRKWILEFMKNDKIYLPSTKDNSPDLEFMKNYIKALKKSVIKDLVIWKDKEIAVYKEVINV